MNAQADFSKPRTIEYDPSIGTQYGDHEKQGGEEHIDTNTAVSARDNMPNVVKPGVGARHKYAHGDKEPTTASVVGEKVDARTFDRGDLSGHNEIASDTIDTTEPGQTEVSRLARML